MATDRRETVLAVHIRNDDYSVSLERRKNCKRVPYADAARHGRVRVVDESGEDYLCQSEYFVRLKLPAPTEQAVIEAA